MGASARRNLPVVTPTRVLVGVLLLLPFVATLWVSSYAHVEPRLGGFPFFYWYQLLWIFLSALCTGGAYLLVQREKRHTGSRQAAVDDTEGGAR
ncbi:MAG: DUF3311 domain-containing protein [Actinopolymorphaceae bacterium]